MVSPTQQAPLLSVTVLNYNYAHYLPTCLDSILGQTFTDFEVILINDTSTDNSLEVIQPYLADPRVRLVDHEVNKGFVASLIEGADLSRGKYITVMSADDWSVDLTAFEKQVRVLEQNPNVVFAYTSYGLYADESHQTFVTRAATESCIRPGQEVFQDFILTTVPLHSGTIIRKSAYEAVGGYDPKIRYSLDAQIFLGLCHFGDVAYIDELLYAYRRHLSSMSKGVDALRLAILEVFDILDWSFGFMPEAKRQELHWLYTKARRRALVAFAVDAIFSNQYRLGWRFFRVGVQISPTQTILQKTTIVLVLRTLLGERGFALIDRLKDMVLARRVSILRNNPGTRSS